MREVTVHSLHCREAIGSEHSARTHCRENSKHRSVSLDSPLHHSRDLQSRRGAIGVSIQIFAAIWMQLAMFFYFVRD